ncbi:hypothetical protein SCLCIDRAFT_33728 [Scleroderma citrinum Foug A]|uniref:Uncharacterized protein n=1 Tax=Scleroderma citrinum Foug A TaxID=1036808 RepID=A0A0C3D405_9AGAM|nr:hypothetical protein SCLCIDRAFT_33728 [Scleroderma citrinum Foug A]
MLVVDLLHEFELGVWKVIFTHLLRLLDAAKQGRVHELNRHYCQVPTFSWDTIQCFRSNSSKMKKMAARDFKDLLLCSIPVFEDLLPEPHNDFMMKLLFLLCHWHGLAKLCMHTEDTLRLMESVTVMLGNHLRTFTNETCATFSTKELHREAEAQTRRQARETLLKQGVFSRQPNNTYTSTRKAKTLNLQTYKLHALGDYVEQIQTYGTTDSYSTQGSLSTMLKKIDLFIQAKKSSFHNLLQLNDESLPDKPEDCYHIGQTQNFPEDLIPFVRKNSADPLMKNFILQLKAHLLPRVQALHEANVFMDLPEPSVTADATDIEALSMLNQVVFQRD